MGWAGIDQADVQNRQSSDAIGGHSTRCGGKPPAGRTGVVLAILGSGFAMTIQAAPIARTGMTLRPSRSGATALVVAPAEHLEVLAEHLQLDAKLITFPDTSAGDALWVLNALRPDIVLLDEPFAGTPRGALFVSRARALATPSLRLLSVADYHRVARGPWGLIVPGHPLPHHYLGTRRDLRVEIPGGLQARINCEEATLLDVSTHGALVLTPLRLHPGRQVRLQLQRPVTVRCVVSIVWVSFERTLTLGGTRYRTGLETLTGDLGDLCVSLDRGSEART